MHPLLRTAVVAALLLASHPGLAAGLEARISPATTSDAIAVSQIRYKGRDALQTIDRAPENRNRLVMLPVTDFRDGVIEADVVGFPSKDAQPGARGFIGLAFRVSGPLHYEAFYIRPTNARSDDQARRNHTIQYMAMPDHDGSKLRTNFPGLYESYADMVVGEWTHLRIEVEGQKARLYVGSAEQPALIVNDLKLGAEAAGAVALWVGSGTEGYFADVKVEKRGG